jgi:hypothetical protein
MDLETPSSKKLLQNSTSEGGAYNTINTKDSRPCSKICVRTEVNNRSLLSEQMVVELLTT